MGVDKSHKRQIIFYNGGLWEFYWIIEHRTSNIERPTSNFECEKMKKQTFGPVD